MVWAGNQSDKKSNAGACQLAKKNQNTMKAIGLTLLVVGAGLALWGYQLSGSFSAQVSRTFTGSETDKIMMLYIGGAASFVVGLFLIIKK